MAKIAQRVAEEEHLAYSNGRVLYVTSEDGERAALPDRLPNLQAVDRLGRIEDQRSRLLGLYAPTAARIEIIPRSVVEQMVRDNEAQIVALERDLVPPARWLIVRTGLHPRKHRTECPGVSAGCGDVCIDADPGRAPEIRAGVGLPSLPACGRSHIGQSKPRSHLRPRAVPGEHPAQARDR